MRLERTRWQHGACVLGVLLVPRVAPAPAPAAGFSGRVPVWARPRAMATDFLDAFSFPLEKLSLAELERRTPPPPPSQTAPASTGQDAEMPPVDALDELEDSRVLHDVLHAPRDAAPELSPEPLNSSHLSKCYYLHGLFEESFMDLLGALAEELPGDTASNNMAAVCVWRCVCAHGWRLAHGLHMNDTHTYTHKRTHGPCTARTRADTPLFRVGEAGGGAAGETTQGAGLQ